MKNRIAELRSSQGLTQQGLADEMGKEASGPTASGDIAAMDGGDSTESPGEGEILAMNDSPQEFDPITGIEDAAQMKIFNPDADEEDSEDEEEQ